MKQLAEADMQEVVADLAELYCDFLALAAHLYSVPGPDLATPLLPLSSRWGEEGLLRSSQAITGLLLATKQAPTIRKGSPKYFQVQFLGVVI